MIRWLLSLFGYKIVFVSDFGVHDHRYDSTDYAMGRPVHKDMSVAPPWAKMKVVKKSYGI